MAKKPSVEKPAQAPALDPAELDGVSGGTAGQVTPATHEIVSPRDPASGLPTGKRMHKPFTFT